MIQETLNKDAINRLFEAEAFYIYDGDAIPEYRIVELFGAAAAEYIERNIGKGRPLMGYYNAIGNCSAERPYIRYFYKPGFEKIVSNHNYLITAKAHKESESSKIIDAIWAEREKRLDLADKENLQREEKRK